MILRCYSYRLLMVSAFVTLTLTASVVACGSSETGVENGVEQRAEAETDVNTIGERIEISAWTRPNAEFSYEDFIGAGWKQRQVYDIDTLPLALEARYGFFNRRDVEIRRYATHDDAMSTGAQSAEEAIDRTVHDGSGFASRRVYGGYLIVGNLVMMCEVSTDDCMNLIEAVESLDSE